jgi:hypothetical protein
MHVDVAAASAHCEVCGKSWDLMQLAREIHGVGTALTKFKRSCDELLKETLVPAAAPQDGTSTAECTAAADPGPAPDPAAPPENAEPRRDFPSIDPEFSILVPPATDEERDGLRTSIAEHGCRDALVVWKDKDEYILLDGHTRLAICRELGVEFKTIAYPFADRAAAMAWIITNALARRNLTKQQASDLRGKRYLAERKDPKDTLKQNAPPCQIGEAAPAACPDASPDVLGAPELTAEKIARETGVSPRTILRDAEYSRHLDKIGAAAGPEARAAIVADKVKVTRDQVRELAAAGADVAAAFDRLSHNQRKKTGFGEASRRAASRPDGCSKINKVAARLASLIARFATCGACETDRTRLSSLWTLRREIDALDAALDAPAGAAPLRADLAEPPAGAHCARDARS